MTIPAPNGFSSVGKHLDKCGINPSELSEVLQDYLNKPENQVKSEFDFHGFQYREKITDFMKTISDFNDEEY